MMALEESQNPLPIDLFQACELIKSSWHEATVKAAATGRHFGYFVFQRVFQKDPTLKTVFGMKPVSAFEA